MRTSGWSTLTVIPKVPLYPAPPPPGSIENDWALIIAYDVESYRYRGRIDEVEIFRRALSEDEIRRPLDR